MLGNGRRESDISDETLPGSAPTFVFSGTAERPSPAPSSSVCQSPEPFTAPDSPTTKEPGSLNLKFLAAGALAFSSGSAAGACAPIPRGGVAAVSTFPEPGLHHVDGEKRRQVPEGPARCPCLPIRGDGTSLGASTPVFSSSEHYPCQPAATTATWQAEATPSTSPQQPGSGGLPPLQIDSPRSESSSQGQALPSIRQHFSDLQLSPDKDASGRRHASSFSRSPPSGLPGISSITSFTVGPHPTSPTSPVNNFRRDLPSPQALGTPSYGFYPYAHGRLTAGELNKSASESTASDPSVGLQANSAMDRLAIDGLIGSAQQGTYVCTFTGCTAAPFQTQYLLNSHANVHSSARPHYCPVPGCPRSEGGKGFKRKNEMIRHGLVHESPGYVCPFCPDREHKYPRPDNLQR